MSALVPTDANGAMQLANIMATGKLVPAHLQKSPGDCLMVIEQAMRWGMSPFAVAQCTSVIQGKLMFEGKLVAAALQSSGILSGRLDYKFKGEGANREIEVSATMKGDTEPRTITLRLADAKTSNGMWVKQPDQQLVYAGTRVWGRRWAPEVMLGVYSPEEMEVPPPIHDGKTIEGTAERTEGPATREEMNASIPLSEKPKELTAEERRENALTWTSALIQRIKLAEDVDTITHDIPNDETVKQYRAALEKNHPDLAEDISDALGTRYGELTQKVEAGGPF